MSTPPRLKPYGPGYKLMGSKVVQRTDDGGLRNYLLLLLCNCGMFFHKTSGQITNARKTGGAVICPLCKDDR